MFLFHSASVVSVTGRGGRNASIGNQDVDATELHGGIMEAGNHLVFLGNVDQRLADEILAEGAGKFGLGGFKRRFVKIGEHHAGTFAQKARRRGLADAAGAASDQGHPARKRFGFRHALQLGFFEKPVFDVEGFLLRQALIG